MKTYISILLFFSSINSNAQRIRTEFLLSKADSILYANVNEELYKCASFNFNQGSYYSYVTKNNIYRSGRIKPNKKTKGNFVNANIRYVFNLPIKVANSSVFVSFNKKFELVDPLNLDFIPDFVKEGKPFNFISLIKAAEIGLDSLKHRGLYLEGPFFKYSDIYKRHVYEINDIILNTTNENGRKSGIKEVIIIDAITGQILYHETENYGWILIR